MQMSRGNKDINVGQRRSAQREIMSHFSWAWFWIRSERHSTMPSSKKQQNWLSQ